MIDGPRLEFNELLNWAEGRADTSTSAAISASLARGDERIRNTIEWIRSFLSTSAVPVEEPPPVVAQRLREHFVNWAESRTCNFSRSTQGRSLVEHAARIVFDSRRDLLTAGIRAGDSSSDVIHLAYTFESGDLVIDVRPAGLDSVDIDGQMLLLDSGPSPVFEATLSDRGVTVLSVAGDRLGRFRLPAVPSTCDELRVNSGHVTTVAVLSLQADGE